MDDMINMVKKKLILDALKLFNIQEKIILRFCSPLSAWAYHPTAGLTSICLQTDVKDHAASLGVIYGQYVKFLVKFQIQIWLSRSVLLLEN